MKKTFHSMFVNGEITRREYNDFVAKNNGYKNRREYFNELRYERGERIRLGTNKECASYLGVYITEQILSKIFNNVIRMPNGNKGYDFICGKGYKIDVKSACLTNNGNDIRYWHFNIFYNKLPDYFLLLAFDNRKDLNPKHIWLIKGEQLIMNIKLNNRNSLKITPSIKSMQKYKNYEVVDKLEKIISCCNNLKLVGKT